MTSYYDPEHQPNAAEWLALCEQEQIRVVKNFHVTTRAKLPDMIGHAYAHVVVESQIARGYGPSRRAIARLQEQGLTRHEAIHAIAAVVSRCLRENPIGTNAVSAKVMQTRMNDELNALSVTNLSGIS